MRTVLVTGPGGAGRTTVAAATALAAADRGSRTLLLSSEAIPGFPAATGPTPVADRLDHVRIDSGEHFRAELTELQNRASGVLDLLGAGRLDGEELTELPGSPQLALLHTLRRAAEGDLSGYDTLVVDLPPLTEALALLALPEQLRRYLRRLLPAERQAARALRPVLAQLAGVPMPAQWLYEAAARKDEELAAVQALIEDGTTTLRLVAEPGPAAEDALRTARTGLALHGLTADLLVASRVLPRHSSDPWFAALCRPAGEVPGPLAPGPGPRPPRARGRPPGPRLRGRGRPGRAGDPRPRRAAVRPGRRPWWTEEEQDADDGTTTIAWCLPLPGAAKEDLRLVRRGDELLLTVGPFHRIVRIASALRRCTVSGAALADGVLRVRFTPDPALWPRTS